MRYIYSITLNGYCSKSLNSLIQVIKNFFLNNTKKISIINLPKVIKKTTVIKSPHIFNKSREHFESITYKKLIIFYIDNSVDNLLINNFLKGIYWSIFGVTLKKKKNIKKCLYK